VPLGRLTPPVIGRPIITIDGGPLVTGFGHDAMRRQEVAFFSQAIEVRIAAVVAADDERRK
jgi:hypothetical protein